MRTALILLALLAAPAFAAQTVWMWKDEKDVTHYSDQPVPGAQRVEISTGSRSDPYSPSPNASSRTNEPAEQNYRDLEVLKPVDQESVVNTGGAVDVRVRFGGELLPGHILTLFLDGRQVQEFPTNVPDYTLQNVVRGTHTIVAIIQDARGNRIKQSPQITFHVRQESIAQPPVGSTLRPTPRPRNR